MHIVIFSGGSVISSRLTEDALTHADFIFAADSGAKNALHVGCIPQVVIGDMDSIDSETKKKLRKKNISFVTFSKEKDETDTQLAIEYAIQYGATEITLIAGTFGERIDHILANVFLGISYDIPITFINGLQKSFFVKGPKKIMLTGLRNDLLSLIPIGSDATGIFTKGLRWELQNSILVFGKPRGVSNIFLKTRVEIIFEKGQLFVTHTLLQ